MIGIYYGIHIYNELPWYGKYFFNIIGHDQKKHIYHIYTIDFHPSCFIWTTSRILYQSEAAQQLLPRRRLHRAAPLYLRAGLSFCVHGGGGGEEAAAAAGERQQGQGGE